MNQVHFTFNNFFDYSIIIDKLHINRKWLFNPDEFILTFSYIYTSEGAIIYIEDLCKPLNIQFTTSFEITKDIE